MTKGVFKFNNLPVPSRLPTHTKTRQHTQSCAVSTQQQLVQQVADVTAQCQLHSSLLLLSLPLVSSYPQNKQTKRRKKKGEKNNVTTAACVWPFLTSVRVSFIVVHQWNNKSPGGSWWEARVDKLQPTVRVAPAASLPQQQLLCSAAVGAVG